MSVVGDVVGDVVGGITGAKQAGEAAEAAGATQAAAAEAGMAEQRRQFEAITEMMAPFLGVGTEALEAQRGLVGLGSPAQQQQAIAALQASPQFGAITRAGEEALLQNVAATGGLRGGNIQGALAQFRPQMLSQLIESQYAKLGGLASQGQAAAGMQAGAGQASAANIANLLGQAGAARAGGQLAQGQVAGQAFGTLAGGAGAFIGAGGMPGLKALF
jgi:hypothetical protein